MYFKKLELIGFKSFPEKTEINFEPGITAIIGPNGCGKTNISDSIRWVIGEQSAKSLRGHRMEDVIFNGTEIHKPLSMVEVSLTLNNEDKIIPIEYSEVTVTRRCYRSGESEYFINKNPCRLRDIQELFMDTGIGTESYSVMEQGKVDLILSSKPEDRRFVLEEAAGIAKYNARKNAALRKLELTSQNLLRIDDIIAEVKREIISIKRQVTKAEKYKENYERLKSLDSNLSLKKYKSIKSEMEVLQEKINQLKDESNKLDSEVAQPFASTRERFLALADQLNNIESRIGALKERMEHLKTRSEKANLELKDIQGKIIEIQRRIEADEKEKNGVLENIKSTESSLPEKENIFNSLLIDVKNKEKELEEYKNVLFEKVREITALNNEKEKINLNLADIERRFARLTREREERQREGKDVFIKIDLLVNGLAELDKGCESYVQSITAIIKETEKITGHSSDLIPQLSRIEAEMSQRCKKREIKRLQQGLEEISAMVSGSKRKETQGEDISLELKELEDESNSLGVILTQTKESLDSLEKERHGFKEEIDRKTGEFQNLKTGLEEAREIKEKLRLSSVSFKEKERGMELHLKTLRERLAEYTQNTSQLKQEITHAGSESENLKDNLEALQKEREGLFKEKISFKEEMDRLEEERKKGDAVFRELHNLEISGTQKEAELSNLKERISNLYHVDLEKMGTVPLGTVPNFFVESGLSPGKIGTVPDNEEEVKVEIESLRQKVEAMGPVNLMALEENKELEDRFSLLKKEREDILKAREELHQAISKINHTCRQIFSETLEKVRTEFHKIFRLLFNGGKADLILQEGDILESGIEIVARPPGKNLSTISQLSGGEKALTAIALLFALFRIKPSPFCVLDEIDAPLDDSNIGRFGSLIKEFLKTTQFIIITHSKKTVSLAQVIYGITMEEPGISKILSVKFRDSRVPAPSSVSST